MLSMILMRLLLSIRGIIETVVEVLATLSRSWKLSNPNTLAFIRGLDLLPTASDQADGKFP